MNQSRGRYADRVGDAGHLVASELSKSPADTTLQHAHGLQLVVILQILHASPLVAWILHLQLAQLPSHLLTNINQSILLLSLWW